LFVATNYLEVFVDDEEITLKQLNQLCGTKHDIFTKAIIPRKSLLIESPNVKTVEDKETRHVDVVRNYFVKSNILTHFIKGKNPLSPMKTILAILGELEFLESMVKLA